jgi:hypothetical protein
MWKRTAVLLVFPALVHSQSLTAFNFFQSDTVSTLYLGIDFTKARLINDPTSKPDIIQQRQFNGINDLMLKEPKKYDFKEALRRTNWKVDISEVEKRNLLVDARQLQSTNDSDLHWMRKPDLDSLVRDFNFTGHTGYGILLIVEGMSKSQKIITVWYTLIDMENKKVLFSSLLSGGIIGGFGFRNYWASAIKSTIMYVNNTSYAQWQKKLGVK